MFEDMLDIFPSFLVSNFHNHTSAQPCCINYIEVWHVFKQKKVGINMTPNRTNDCKSKKVVKPHAGILTVSSSMLLWRKLISWVLFCREHSPGYLNTYHEKGNCTTKNYLLQRLSFGKKEGEQLKLIGPLSLLGPHSTYFNLHTPSSSFFYTGGEYKPSSLLLKLACCNLFSPFFLQQYSGVTFPGSRITL